MSTSEPDRGDPTTPNEPPDDGIDTRTVHLPPAGTGSWYESDPGVFHTSLGCAARGINRAGLFESKNTGNVKEVYLEKAVKEGYTGCGICAADVEHDFEAADYP